MKRRRFVLASVLAVAVGSATLAACGEPEYEYVRNRQARTAFKIPHGWTVFDEAAMQGGDPEETQASTPDPIDWLVGLDGDPSPAREHVLSVADGYDTAYPHGIAAVYRLSTLARERVSLSALRNILIPIDTIGQEGSEAISIIAYDDRLDVDGYRGLHLEAQVSISALEAALGLGGASGDASSLANDEYLHINQTAYMDPSADKVYILAVLCSAECYERNRDDIETVVDSWAVIA